MLHYGCPASEDGGSNSQLAAARNEDVRTIFLEDHAPLCQASCHLDTLTASYYTELAYGWGQQVQPSTVSGNENAISASFLMLKQVAIK